MTINSFSVLAFSCVLLMSSCSKEGCTDPVASNYDSEADVENNTCIYDVVAPDQYFFTDNAGNNTVSLTGQWQRLNMLSEMVDYLKTANTPGISVDETTLHAMYANDSYTWIDTEDLVMTGSSKQLKNKTAGGDLAITDIFDGFMSDVAAASALTVEGATSGSAGVDGVVLSSTNPDKQYLQSGQGQEWTQLIEKGLMGACFYYNISSVYFSASKMDVDNSMPVDTADGKYYTAMEHHWDEAYGYFTEKKDYPSQGTNRFWGKYAFARETPLGSATIISEAFRLGRQAIVLNSLDLRDEQIAIIRTEMERVAGGTAIHYLNDAVEKFADDALRNHALSEAKAFIMALPYGVNTSVDVAAADQLLNTLGSDFYNVTPASIIDTRDALAGYLDLLPLVNSL